MYGYLTLACFCSSCLLIVGLIGLSLASGTFNTKRYDEHYKEVMAKQKEEQEEMKTAFKIKNGAWEDFAFKVGDYLQYSEFDDEILYMKPGNADHRPSLSNVPSKLSIASSLSNVGVTPLIQRQKLESFNPATTGINDTESEVYIY